MAIEEGAGNILLFSICMDTELPHAAAIGYAMGIYSFVLSEKIKSP